MPFQLIPAVLGTSFVLIWVFICGMILRDSQREARREHELSKHMLRAQRPRRRSRRRSSESVMR